LFWFTARFARPSALTPSRKVFGASALVLSQDELFAQIVTRYVEAWGMASRRVSSAADARATLRSARVEGTAGCVAIIDAEAEGADEIAALLRSPEFAASARLITVGGDEAVVKPLRQSQLFDRVVTALAQGVPAQWSPHENGDPRAAHVNQKASGVILVAEDNASLQELLVHQFSRLGYRVTIVSDGLQVVDAVRREDVALVFMDCQMPNMDGFEATRLIREDERLTGEHVPIVAVTANAFREDRDACLAAGMDDYLSKPVRINELRSMVERWVGRSGGTITT
jgi:CheY-like chemotaxis protein